MLGLNGYAVGAAMLGDSLNTSEIKAIKLEEEENLTFGYITRKGAELSEMAQAFVEKLKVHS